MTWTGVSPIARSSPIWRRCASTRPPIAVASVKAAASSASTVVVCRIVEQPPRVVGALLALRAPVERAHGAVARRRGPRTRACRGRLAEAQADAELQRPLGGGEPEHVGRVGPATVGRAGARADADHAQLAPRRAAAGRDLLADVDAVRARELALQDDLAGRAPGATFEDQRALDARPRAREPDQPERVALAAEAHGDAHERPRALGGGDAGQRGDAGERLGARCETAVTCAPSVARNRRS